VIVANQSPVDGYTLLHFATGAALARAGLPWWAAVVAAVGWELAEDRLKRRYPGIFPRSSDDSKENALVDAGAVMLGWGVGRA
jgi:hypothetical protein